jgi:hypothetical protein
MILKIELILLIKWIYLCVFTVPNPQPFKITLLSESLILNYYF